MRPRLATWWTIFRVALQERLVYRADFALGTLMRFLPIVTQVFLWWAVFETVRRGPSGAPMIANYTFENMVAYYLLTMIGRAFSSMPGLAGGIASDVRGGDIKKFLVQPIDLLEFLFLSRLAHKVAYYSVALLPFALVFALCRGYFVDGWPPPATFGAFLLSLALSFLLGFYLEAALGLASFWFMEISSLLFVYMLLSFFLSGHMFPLDLLPPPWSTLVDILPLKYLAYFPAAVFLEKIPPERLWWELGLQAAWTGFFIALCQVLWRRGTRRYSAFGG